MILALARMIKAFAHRHGSAVLGTSHTRPASVKWSSAERSALGWEWSAQAHTQVMFSRADSAGAGCSMRDRRAEIVSSTRHMIGQHAQFHISEAGAVGGLSCNS